jgi:hypothetical protein
MVFATPDFGASAAVGCFLLVVWACVLVFAGLGAVRGLMLLHPGSPPRGRRCGVILVLASGLLPLSCCLGPAQLVRLAYGNYPLGSYPNGKVQEGMTADEVVATLGSPHERHKQGEGERWYYWIDSFGMHWFGVEFGPDGRVVHTYGD